MNVFGITDNQKSSTEKGTKNNIGEPVFKYGDLLSSEFMDMENLYKVQDLKQYTIYLKNSDPNKIKIMINSLFPEQRIAIDERSRSISCLTDEESYKKIRKAIRRVDRILKQIQITVEIVEVNYQSFDEYRSFFSDLTAGFKINYDFKTGAVLPVSDLEGKLIGMINKGEARVLAKPVISTIDNHKALINIGDKVPYVTTVAYEHSRANQVHHLDTGIELSILPQIVNSKLVLANVDANVSTIKMWKEFGEAKYPVLSKRQTQTMVYIPDGKTLVIAGLMDEQIKVNESKLPIVGDLPLIGGLFRSKSKEKINSDILFMITPKIQK